MKKVTLIPGDGIGPEISQSVVEIFAAAKVAIAWETVECGIHTFEKTGELIPKKLEHSLAESRVALKGPTTTPVGSGHRSINVTLRQNFDLFANTRPVRTIPDLDNFARSVDMFIVRENTEDLYKGIEYKIGNDTAHGIKLITRSASERIAKYAFESARRLKRKKVTVVHKANIMKLTDGLFLEAVGSIAKSYPDIQYNDIIVDNCCMQMVTRPEQFDVIVTQNLYGDIISDLASGLVGGLGIAAGANIGESMAVFEAVHGSAPDIAGKGLANPTALLSSAILMLEHLEMLDEAQRIQNALYKTLGHKETRTKDLGGTLSTKDFTKAVIAQL
jgi:isocitrate dehydrogenase (NAD+)